MGTRNYTDAKIALHNAENYLSIIGRTTTSSTVAIRDGERATAGSLHTLAVSTEMHFQPYDGAPNYHKCKEFDAALSKAVRRRWTELSAEAMQILRDDRDQHKAEAKQALEAMLAEIDGDA